MPESARSRSSLHLSQMAAALNQDRPMPPMPQSKRSSMSFRKRSQVSSTENIDKKKTVDCIPTSQPAESQQPQMNFPYNNNFIGQQQQYPLTEQQNAQNRKFNRKLMNRRKSIPSNGEEQPNQQQMFVRTNVNSSQSNSNAIPHLIYHPAMINNTAVTPQGGYLAT